MAKLLMILYYIITSARSASAATAAGSGLIAYNCSHEDATSREYSLVQQRACPDYSLEAMHTERQEQLQLLQKREFLDIRGRAAKVVRTLFVLPCGGGQVTQMYTQRVLELSREEVKAIYDHGEWQDEWLASIPSGGGKMTNLVFNGTTTKTRNLRGWTDGEGWCQGRSFKLHGITYTDAVLQGTYDVYLADSMMTIDLANNWIRTMGGLTCEYTKGHCQDYIYGDIYWSTDFVDPEECDSTTYIVLYEGPATISSYLRTSMTAYTEIATVEKGPIAFSLVRTAELLICGQRAAATEHPKLFLLSTTNNLRFFKDQTLHRLDLDLNMYSDTRFMYLTHHISKSMKDINAQVMSKICELETQTVAALQALAMVDPIEFAYSWNKKPGFSALIRGEVAHLIKCVPVSVHIHTTDHCTNELPVLYMGRTLYMNSRSHILSTHGEKVACNAMFPVKYRIQNHWFTLGPTLVKATPPEILKLNINYSDWTYTDINIGTSGIYSPQDVNRQRMAVLFPLEMRAITRSIASTVGGYQSSPGSNFQFSNLVDQNYLQDAIRSYWDKLHSGLQSFGIYSGMLVGIIMIFRLASTLLKGGLNFYILTNMFTKCGAMLGVVCPTLAHSAMIFGNEEIKQSGNGKATIKGTYKAFKNKHKAVADPEEQKPGGGTDTIYPDIMA